MKALRQTGDWCGVSTCYGESFPGVRTVPVSFDLLDLHARKPERYPCLLQSTAQGRFDILFAFPGETLRLDPAGLLSGPPEAETRDGDFLGAFDRWWSTSKAPPSLATDRLPFAGGWFLYLGYELAAQIEPCLRLPPAADVLPVACATRFATAIVRDHERRTTVIVAEPGHEERIPAIERDILSLPPAERNEERPLRLAGIEEAAPERYLQAVARIHRYIRDGDVFQVNISRPWRITAREPIDAATLYRSLRRHNPAPYSGIARWGKAAIISSSPERLVRVRGRMVETRPIAGTRPRDLDGKTDSARCAELLAHPKERAEHVMLIDLERNDLGRICTPGTVRVDEFMVPESYAHVHHIVSNVKGELRIDVTPGQVLRAVFPGGTITGCPKVRCMEIIAELEQEGRGAYTGSMGYIRRDGGMDMNILIRSMTAFSDRVHLRAGAGIVADSVPVAELEETRAKARGLLRALGLGES